MARRAPCVEMIRMPKRFGALAFALVGLIVLAAPATPRADPRDGDPVASPIPGALDPTTGFFMPRAAESEAAAAGQTRAGQFIVVARIALQPSIDPKAPITCYFQLQHSGYAYSQEVGRVRGARSGNIGTCQIVIPYNWVQVNPSVQVRFVYSISAGAFDVRHRESSGNRGLPLPAHNAVTDVSLSVRL